jgi:hypothetical protein
MKTSKFIFLLVGFIFLLIVPQYAYSQSKKVAHAYRIDDEAPRIDGRLDDTAWQEVEWQNNFIQRQPYDGKAPSQSTEFKILYNDNSIFVAVRSWDAFPDSIVSRLSRRDSGDGDAIGVEFDSYNDKKTAFSFIVFSSGVKHDKLITGDGENEDVTWDAIWDAKTSIDDKGWIAEIEIPFNQLRFNNNKEQVWGLQVGRYIHRKDELSLWQPIPRDAPGWVHQFGALYGITGIKPKRQIEVAPYIVAQTERFETEEGNPFATGKRNRFSGGVDAKIGLTNDITLDMTVFPDFGQVEADPSEVNLTAYESYFPEKRPFFIEGKNLFDFQFTPGDGDHSAENLFYSRRIGRRPNGEPDLGDNEFVKTPENTTILGAAKITGKNKNGLSFGIVEAITDRMFAEIGENGNRRLEAVEPLTSYFVGGLAKDYNNANTRVGGIVTSTNRVINDSQLDFLHTNAITGGINFIHQWKNKSYQINFKSYFSHVAGSEEAILRTQRASSRYFQRPDATHLQVDSSRTSLTGQGGLVSIGKVGDGHWQFMGFVSWKSPELEVNDLGFVRGVDDIFQVIWAQYKYWEPFSIFREININFNQWTGHNFGGELNYFGGNINVNSQLKNYWRMGFGVGPQGRNLSPSALRGGPSLRIPGGINHWQYVNSDSRKNLMFSLSTSFHNSVSANQQTYSAGITYRPTNAVEVSVSPMFSNSDRKMQYVSNIDWENTTSYINASFEQQLYILQLRVNYSVTPDISIQYYGRPFFAKGKYFDFKKITNPRASKFEDSFHLFTSNQISYETENEVYYIDEGGNGSTDYSFDNPNFNIRSFQSNLVVRWEYLPGSTLFLVWSQGRDSFDSDYNLNINYSANELWNSHPHNIFLVKLSYRFY